MLFLTDRNNFHASEMYYTLLYIERIVIAVIVTSNSITREWSVDFTLGLVKVSIYFTPIPHLSPETRVA